MWRRTRFRRSRLRSRDRWVRALDEAIAHGGPWYGLAGQTNHDVSGSGGGGDDVHVELRYVLDGGRWVTVATDTSGNDPGRDGAAVDEYLEEQLGVHGRYGQDVDFPLKFELTVNRWEAEIAVADTPVTFAFIGTELGWVARAMHGGRTIKIKGHGLDPSTVVLVAVRPSRQHRIGPSIAELRSSDPWNAR